MFPFGGEWNIAALALAASSEENGESGWSTLDECQDPNPGGWFGWKMVALVAHFKGIV